MLKKQNHLSWIIAHSQIVLITFLCPMMHSTAPPSSLFLIDSGKDLRTWPEDYSSFGKKTSQGETHPSHCTIQRQPAVPGWPTFS
jgi:hypothetical protein